MVTAYKIARLQEAVVQVYDYYEPSECSVEQWKHCQDHSMDMTSD